LIHQAILIFEVLHPGCIRVFCFNQSTNHNAIAADTLIASRMNMNSQMKQLTIHNSWYVNEYSNKIEH
ncbi:12560_t:CDS:1, partial [Funneliformis caledonium]